MVLELPWAPSLICLTAYYNPYVCGKLGTKGGVERLLSSAIVGICTLDLQLVISMAQPLNHPFGNWILHMYDIKCILLCIQLNAKSMQPSQFVMPEIGSPIASIFMF